MGKASVLLVNHAGFSEKQAPREGGSFPSARNDSVPPHQMQPLKFGSLLSIVFLTLTPSSPATLVMGGFNSDRVGIGNVVNGVITEDIRALVSTAWSDATFIGTNLLSPSFLSTVDFLLI